MSEENEGEEIETLEVKHTGKEKGTFLLLKSGDEKEKIQK
jgi:hypothetical protein